MGKKPQILFNHVFFCSLLSMKKVMTRLGFVKLAFYSAVKLDLFIFQRWGYLLCIYTSTFQPVSEPFSCQVWRINVAVWAWQHGQELLSSFGASDKYIVSDPLGRELSHLLRSMSNREAEFSLLRSWSCKFLHPQPPHSCSEGGRASEKWCYPVWHAHRTGAHLTSLDRECSCVLFLPQAATRRRGFLVSCWQCSGLSSIMQDHSLWKASVENIKSNSTLLNKGHLERIPKVMSGWVMSISKNGDSTSTLGDLLQCLTTFTMKGKKLATTQIFSYVQMESAWCPPL